MAKKYIVDLNEVEETELVEVSVLTQQCLDRRLGNVEIVETEVAVWEDERNTPRATIDWRFTIPNASDKLKKLYPVREGQ